MMDAALRGFARYGLGFPSVPAQEGYYTSEDCRLYYSVFGKGPAVMMLHGGMGNSSNWAHQIASVVQAGYQAIVMDTRAHGRSTSGTQQLSYRVFAQDVLRLLDFLSLNKVTIVGWSDGACTALEVARIRSASLRAVIFFACNVDPSGLKEFRMTESIQNCVTRHRIDFESMTPTLERFEDLQPKLDPMQKNEPNYSPEDLKMVTVPVAVVQGDRDEFITLEHAQYLSRALGNGSFALLEGQGHFAPIEDPEAFNAALLTKLALVSQETER